MWQPPEGVRTLPPVLPDHQMNRSGPLLRDSFRTSINRVGSRKVHADTKRSSFEPNVSSARDSEASRREPGPHQCSLLLTMVIHDHGHPLAIAGAKNMVEHVSCLPPENPEMTVTAKLV